MIKSFVHSQIRSRKLFQALQQCLQYVSQTENSYSQPLIVVFAQLSQKLTKKIHCIQTRHRWKILLGALVKSLIASVMCASKAPPTTALSQNPSNTIYFADCSHLIYGVFFCISSSCSKMFLFVKNDPQVQLIMLILRFQLSLTYVFHLIRLTGTTRLRFSLF